jgi:hypothetical protein
MILLLKAKTNLKLFVSESLVEKGKRKEKNTTQNYCGSIAHSKASKGLSLHSIAVIGHASILFLETV